MTASGMVPPWRVVPGTVSSRVGHPAPGTPVLPRSPAAGATADTLRAVTDLNVSPVRLLIPALDGDHERMAHIVLEGFKPDEGDFVSAGPICGRRPGQRHRRQGPVRQDLGAEPGPEEIPPVPDLQGDRRGPGLAGAGELGVRSGSGASGQRDLAGSVEVVQGPAVAGAAGWRIASLRMAAADTRLAPSDWSDSAPRPADSALEGEGRPGPDQRLQGHDGPAGAPRAPPPAARRARRPPRTGPRPGSPSITHLVARAGLADELDLDAELVGPEVGRRRERGARVPLQQGAGRRLALVGGVGPVLDPHRSRP